MQGCEPSIFQLLVVHQSTRVIVVHFTIFARKGKGIKQAGSRHDCKRRKCLTVIVFGCSFEQWIRPDANISRVFY